MNYVFLIIGFIALVGIPTAAANAVPRQDLSRILNRLFLAIVLSGLGLFEIMVGLLLVEGVFVILDSSSKYVFGALSLMGILGGVVFIVAGARALRWAPQTESSSAGS